MGHRYAARGRAELISQKVTVDNMDVMFALCKSIILQIVLARNVAVVRALGRLN
jgi:hypothetical protein